MHLDLNEDVNEIISPMNLYQKTKLDLNSVINEIIHNKEHLFGEQNKTYTTEKKVAEYLYKNKQTMEQKNLVRTAMRKLFIDCRTKSNNSYYSIIACRDKLINIEELSDLYTNENNDLSSTHPVTTDMLN